MLDLGLNRAGGSLALELKDRRCENEQEQDPGDSSGIALAKVAKALVIQI